MDRGNQSFSLAPPISEADIKPDWIWLPNTLAGGAANEEIPLELIRQSGNSLALRIFIDLYHAQSLADYGGVHWREFFQGYEREKVGERGAYTIWGFAKTTQKGWLSAPFIKPHIAGKNKEEAETAWQACGTALSILEMTGLIEFVGHIVDTDAPEGAVLHPCAMHNGEPFEQEIAEAAHQAGLALLNERQRADAVDRNLWLVPIKRHLLNVQMVGLIRTRYRAQTRATASWLAEDWTIWVDRYRLAENEALGSRC